MKARFLLAAALIFGAMTISIAARAQESESFQQSFSLELGVGAFPLHATFAGLTSEAEYAKLGQRVSSSGMLSPAFSLSEVWRPYERWEFCLTEGVSWQYLNVRQYGVFGTDPNGNPRYDLTKATDTWVKASKPVFSLTGQVRFIWSPKWRVTVYSAAEIGFTSTFYYIPLPGITPVAVRYGGKHLYGFAELTLGPIASIGHGGLGWRF